MKKLNFEKLKKSIADKLSIIKKEVLDDLAQKTSLVMRKTSKLKGSDFFQLMTGEFFDDAMISVEGLCARLKEINPEADMSPQALQQRIVNDKSIAFMKAVFEKVCQDYLAPVIAKTNLSIFEFFDHVYIQDSTQIELNEHLAEHFKGSGGGASKSSLKIDLLFELKQFVIAKLLLSKGTMPDQNRAGSVFDVLKRGDLIIRDLGYFVIESFQQIADHGAYYLSRYKHKVTVYLNNQGKAESIKLLDYLKKAMSSNNVLEMAIFFRRETKTPL